MPRKTPPRIGGRRTTVTAVRSRAVPSLAADAVAAVADFHDDAPEGALRIDPELRREMVATAAYYIAEQRGFAPGHELADWLAAEAAVEATLAEGARS
jgi:hypothetical protein